MALFLKASLVSALAVAATLGCGAAQEHASRAPLRVGTTGDHPPYCESVKEGFVGIDVDLAYDLAASLGRPTVFVRTTWSSMLSDLVEGRFDIAMSGVHVSDQRRAAAQFSHSYLHVHQNGLVRCADVARFVRLADVDRIGVRIFTTLGGVNDDFTRTRFPNASILPVDDREPPQRASPLETETSCS